MVGAWAEATDGGARLLLHTKDSVLAVSVDDAASWARLLNRSPHREVPGAFPAIAQMKRRAVFLVQTAETNSLEFYWDGRARQIDLKSATISRSGPLQIDVSVSSTKEKYSFTFEHELPPWARSEENKPTLHSDPDFEAKLLRSVSNKEMQVLCVCVSPLDDTLSRR